MTNKFQNYIDKLYKTNRTLDSYVNWEKADENMKEHLYNLSVLNVLTKAKNDSEILFHINEIFRRKWDDVFSSLEILIAKRNENEEREYFNFETKEIEIYSFENSTQVFDFMKSTGLLKVFKEVNSLNDYVFGVEVGLDSNGRKNRLGKIMDKLMNDILRDNIPDFESKVKMNVNINEIEGLQMKVLNDEKIKFVLLKENVTYLIQSSFHNTCGSKPYELLKTYISLSKEINDDDFKFIWVADGYGMKKMHQTLKKQWEKINILSLKDFEQFLKE